MTLVARRRRLLRAPLWLLLGWLLFSELVVPQLATWLYEAERWSTVPAIVEARAAASLDEHLAELRAYSRWAALAGLLYVGLVLLLTEPRWVLRVREEGSPANLGFVRIWACLVGIGITLLEGLPSTAHLPREMLDPEGVLVLLTALPGSEALLASAGALRLFEAVGLVVLALAAVGWKSRVTVPAAAIFLLIAQGLLRSYTRFFHTGLVLVYVLLVLSFAPCADALSVDARRRRGIIARDRSLRYGLPLWCCWMVVALPYVEAGLMKLRRGGLDWFAADNLRRIVATDTLGPLAPPGRLGLWLMELPDPLVSGLAVVTVLLELTFGLVLVSRAARRWLPPAMALFHVGTWVLQGVFFLDLALLQIVFLPVGDLLVRDGRRLREQVGDGRSDGRCHVRAVRRWRAGILATSSVFLFAWGLRLEWYPFSAMQMYSGADLSGTVEYLELRATEVGGGTWEVDVTELIPALRGARHRWHLADLLDARGRDRRTAEQLLASLLLRLRQEHGPGVMALEVERRRWDFRRHPDDPHHGRRVALVRYPDSRLAASGP